MVERVSCALVARELGENLAGTAVETTGWIAVEHAGPWTPRAPGHAELGDVAQHLEHDDVRVQLIRAVRAPHTPGPRRAGHDVLLCHAALDPADRWMRRLHVERLDDLLHLDPAVTLRPEPPPIGEPVDTDVWLVCTHARRDACCAVHGRPAAIALALAGTEVWETTHTGGHRFAATAVVLPDGLSLGRLDTVDVVAVATALADGRVPTEVMRGRCAAPRPAQAAEIALRQHLDRTGRDEVLPAGLLDGAGIAVRLRTRGETWVGHMREEAVTPPRPVSDGAEPTTPTQWGVTDWRTA